MQTEISPSPIGRLKRTLSEKCPECGHALQLRVVEEKSFAGGLERTVEDEYIACSVCDYTAKSKKKRRVDFDRTDDAFRSLKGTSRRDGKNNGYGKSGSVRKDSGQNHRGGVR